MANRFRKSPRKEIIANEDASRVSLRPKEGWHRRNFILEVLLPSLFQKRAAIETKPDSPTHPHHHHQIGITWIGHASFLIRMAGFNILIDPNWSLWLKGIKRLKRPGLELHELPSIDLVLVTHAHFDHLDKRTLRAVASNQPIAVPFGVGDLVHKLGFHKVYELNYWQEITFGELKVALTPCQHWGARLLHDQHRGFGGFVLSDVEGRTLYHCGDTAYFEGFKEIANRYPIEIALLPIGAYEPPSGRDVHMNPEEAVQAFIDLKAKWLVPMHYGTFRMSYEPLEEPPQRLIASAEQADLADRVRILNEGHLEIF